MLGQPQLRQHRALPGPRARLRPGTAIWLPHGRPDLGMRMWLARSCSDSGARPPPQPPPAPRCHQMCGPGPRGKPDVVERMDGEIRVSSKHSFESSITGCASTPSSLFLDQDSRVGPFLRGGWEQISQKPLTTSGAEAKAFPPTAAWSKSRTSGQPKP